MEFQDKSLKCVDCGSDFVFTAGEQLFFHDKQFKNEPKRCKNCKAQRMTTAAAAAPGSRGSFHAKVETRTTCSSCGKETTVPSSRHRGVRCCAASASRTSAARAPRRKNSQNRVLTQPQAEVCLSAGSQNLSHEGHEGKAAKDTKYRTGRSKNYKLKKTGCRLPSGEILLRHGIDKEWVSAWGALSRATCARGRSRERSERCGALR